MESRDSSRDPFLRVSFSISKVSGLTSVPEVSGLETFNISKKWLIKISLIQRYLVCCIFRYETTKTRRKKMPDIWKKIRLRSYNNVYISAKCTNLIKFGKSLITFGEVVNFTAKCTNIISAKCTNFEVSSLGLELQVSVLEFLMKSQSRLGILTRPRSQRFRLYHWQ